MGLLNDGLNVTGRTTAPAKAAPDPEIARLRAEAEDGVQVDGRWGADRLREEIDDAVSDDGEDHEQQQDEDAAGGGEEE